MKSRAGGTVIHCWSPPAATSGVAGAIKPVWPKTPQCAATEAAYEQLWATDINRTAMLLPQRGASAAAQLAPMEHRRVMALPDGARRKTQPLPWPSRHWVSAAPASKHLQHRQHRRLA